MNTESSNRFDPSDSVDILQRLSEPLFFTSVTDADIRTLTISGCKREATNNTIFNESLKSEPRHRSDFHSALP